MKVLSDNTADKVLRLISGRGAPPPKTVPRPAPTTPPAPMWQIHVTPDGDVSVDGGDVYGSGGLTHVAASVLGHAEGGECVVWTEEGGLSLESEPDGETPFRLIGRIAKDESGTYRSEQLITGPLELASGSAEHFGDASDAKKEPAWNIADDKPAILETEGAKILVDSRGNVISWTTPSSGGGPHDDPEAPSPPPPCGNPLNGDVTDNPLDRPAADRGTDDNPLDYTGRGGYTPESSGEQC